MVDDDEIVNASTTSRTAWSLFPQIVIMRKEPRNCASAYRVYLPNHEGVCSISRCSPCTGQQGTLPPKVVQSQTAVRVNDTMPDILTATD